MATKIIHKKSSTASSVPAAGSLEPGEIAVNLADKKLYTKTTGGTVIELADGEKLAGIEAGATADQTKADIDALGIDAATLDGIDSSSFIRSDAADTKTSGDLAFSDNVKATFGGASDLQIYHDGSNSYVADSGTGDLILRGSTGIKLQSGSGVLEYLSTNSSTGSVELKLSGATKLATTTTGVDVTGTITVDGLSVDGNITVTGTVDGRDIASDGTKLDGIETGADVTDTANVTAAGALMDSEVTNLAQVKAFDSSDYATAAQGTLADNALPLSGGNITGNLDVAGTINAQSAFTTDQVRHSIRPTLNLD